MTVGTLIPDHFDITVSVSDAQKLICKAKEILKDRGWIQGALYKKEFGAKEASGFCALGALYVACGAIDSQGQRVPEVSGTAVRIACKWMGFESPAALTCWNDELGRTKEEVIHRFEEFCVDNFYRKV